MSVGRFGLCCCQASAGVYTTLTASAIGWGWLDFNVTGVGDVGLDGNTYLTLTAINNTVATGVGFASIHGALVLDKFNGSVVSHVMDQPPNGTALPTGGGTYLGWPPTTFGPTDAEWTSGATVDQSIALSNPVSLDDLAVIVTALLDDADIESLLAGEAWDTRYVSASSFSTTVGNLWVPTWVIDPSDGVTAIGAWANIGTGQVILDRDMPAHVGPAIATTDTGPYTPSGPETVGGPKASVAFSNGSGGNIWGASRLLVGGLVPSSNHCIHDDYDAGAESAGNGDNCGVVTADGLGRLLVGEPGLVINSGDGEESCNRWLWLNYHPSAGGNGCPCDADI